MLSSLVLILLSILNAAVIVYAWITFDAGPAVGISVGSIILFFVIKHPFRKMQHRARYQRKGAMLHNAKLEIHTKTFLPEKSAKEDDLPDVNEEGNEWYPVKSYQIELTITPTDQKHKEEPWDPHHLSLRAMTPSGEESWKGCEIENCEYEDDGEWKELPLKGYLGEKRFRMTVKIPIEINDITFSYYGNHFGSMTVPDWQKPENGGS